MNMPVETARTMSHIENFINRSKGFNSDLQSAISRFDVLCSRLGQNNYVKNQPQEATGAVPVKTSDGLIDDLGELIRQKESLNSELRVVIDYLEAHI